MTTSFSDDSDGRTKVTRAGMILVLAMALTSCAHDSDRANPLDPDLTPPVELVTTVDDTTGSIALTWTAYAGDAPFGRYWVLRKAANLEAVDTLAILSDVAMISYVDTAATQGISYSYRVSVLNGGGLEISSAFQEVRALQLPGAHISSLELDSSTATAKLTWNQYQGPRFSSYQIRRQASGIDLSIASISDLQQLAFTDSGLQGNVMYSYRLVVVTRKGEQIESAPVSDIIHPLVASWPLTLAEDETVRLSLESDGRIGALIAGPGRVRLQQYDTNGQLADEHLLYKRIELPDVAGFGRFADLFPRSVNSAIDEQGRRLLSLANRNRTWVQAWTADGHPESLRAAFTDVDLVPLLTPDWELRGNLSLGLTGEPTSTVAVDHIEARTAGTLFLDESFHIEPAGWMFPSNTSLNVMPEIIDGWLTQEKRSTTNTGLTTFAEHAGPEDPSDMQIQTTMLIADGASAGLRLGAFLSKQVHIDWVLNENDNLLTVDTFRRFEKITTGSQPFDVMPLTIYVLDVQRSNGRLTASLTAPYIWAEETESQPSWGALGVVDGVVAMTHGMQRRGITTQGRTQIDPAAAVVSDVRQWPDNPQLMGLSLPDANEVLIGRASVSSFSGLLSWPSPGSSSTLHIGAGAGQRPGEFVYPLSLDRAQDGRIYVLDAGNARIQVFDETGAFITEWGTKGSGVDQFNFGSGGSSIDFAGSVAVDDDGFIYVADVGNRRMQKFAP
jgi:hypothetical protein